MRTLSLLPAALALLVLAGSVRAQDTNDTFESVVTELLAKMNDFAGALEEVKSNDDAKAAKANLEGQIKGLQELAKRAKKLGKPDQKQKDELKKKFDAELTKTFTRFGKAVLAVSKYPDAKTMIEEFGKEMQKIGQQ